MPFEVTNYLYALARKLHLDPVEKDEIIQELEAHLEDKAAELETQGMDHETAMARAVEEMGTPNAVARGMYEVHSPGVWRDVLLATIPHFLLAAFFALHLWSHYFLVSLLLIAIAFVTSNVMASAYRASGLAPGSIMEFIARANRCHSESRSTRACLPFAVIR